MTRSGGGLAHALRDVLQQLLTDEVVRGLPAFFADFFWSTAVPIAAGLLLSAAIGWLFRCIWRILFPPSPAELHEEALRLLQQQPPALRSASAHHLRRAEALLRKAAFGNGKKGCRNCYAPAVVSLAALQIYRRGDGVAALKLLEGIVPDNGEDLSPVILRGLELDARAAAAGQYQMIQCELRESEFLSVAFAARTGGGTVNNKRPAAAAVADGKKDR